MKVESPKLKKDSPKKKLSDAMVADLTTTKQFLESPIASKDFKKLPSQDYGSSG